MRKLIIVGALLLLAMAGVPAARAQCTGGLINNCPAAISPQAGDFALEWQINQSPHTRKLTNSQVLTGALQSTVIGEINAQVSTSAGAGLNLGVGVTPTNCTSGEVWETGAGLFSCVGGQPVGPYGTGGSILPVYTSSTLPAVTAANAGAFAFVSNCQNGAEGQLGASGCAAVVNNNGVWTLLPSPPSLQITVGGQALYLGGSTANQGNGSKLQLASGNFTAGNALAFDANGNAIDSGTPPGGGLLGGGTVANGLLNSLPFYSAAPNGSVLAPMTRVNNAVVGTSSTGVPSLMTTLPVGLIIPSPTISGPTITGTSSISTTNMSGKLTTNASSAGGGAGFNIAPGSAPIAPNNGDMWGTTSGIFSRINGATVGPFIAGITGTLPIVSTIVGGQSTLTCPTCATTTNGGLLTATAPMSIDASGVISLGLQPAAIVWIADSATVVHNDTYNLYEKWPYASGGSIKSVTYHTGGTSSPSFTISLQINGTPVSGCNSLGVSSGTDVVTTCTVGGSAVILTGQTLSLVITGTTGSPSSAVIQVNYTRPAA